MYASRKFVEQEVEITKRGLRLLRGSGSLPAKKNVAKRDGRIRLVRDSAPADANSRNESAVQRAHERLRLPSLDRWLSGRLW